MTWVRLDDKFPSHPKVAHLSDREFRVHIRVLCYCAEYATDGALYAAVWNEIPGLTRAMGRRFVALGIWDETKDGLEVHDFEQYNAATLEDRVRAFLLANPSASANDVHKALGGTRSVLLDMVQLVRGGSPSGTDPGSDRTTKLVRKSVPKAVLAPTPTPTPTPEEGKEVARGTSLALASSRAVPPARKRDELWDTLVQLLGEPVTDTERGRRNKALKELRKIGATPADLERKAAAYQQRWPDIDLTANALAANWSLLDKPLPHGARLNAGQIMAQARQETR